MKIMVLESLRKSPLWALSEKSWNQASTSSILDMTNVLLFFHSSLCELNVY